MTEQLTVEAHLDLSDQVIAVVSDFVATGGMWLPVALIAAMVLMQGVKAIIKQVMADKYKKSRRWLTFVCAYLVGFQCGVYFLDGADAHKLAVFIGLINPLVYFTLVQYAVSRKRLVLLSLLKMRPIDENKPDRLHETQTFMAKR